MPIPNLGPTELIIILVIALIFFGVGKLGSVGGAFGQIIRDFRKEVSSDDRPSSDTVNRSSGAVSPPPAELDKRFCAACAAELSSGARYCASCGAPVAGQSTNGPATPSASPESRG